MATTQKISVALGREELRLAKTAAHEDGVSLSAFVTRAVREQIEKRRRMEAARQFLATFAPAELPTDEEQRELIDFWNRARDQRPSIRKRPPARKVRAHRR